jgi:SAM-dependent methyltransferase
MSKRKDRRNARQAFESVVAIAGAAARDEEDDAPFAHDHAPVSDQILAVSPDLRRVLTPQSNGVRRELTRMKRFRFQLLHQWICDNVPAPCRVADVGGGKGLLAYLLNQSGYHATTIDPVPQALPAKYKDLAAGRQVRIAETESVPRRDLPFEPDMARDFDLLVAMHAHGCNIALVDAAARFGKSFLVLPCCIIDEPLRPPPGTHWLQCVADYAKSKGFAIEPLRLNFKGQNIGLYAAGPGKTEP